MSATVTQTGRVATVTVSTARYIHPNHTGDVTSAGDGATTITDKAVTLGKIQDIGHGKIIGRHAAGDGTPQEVGIDGGLEIHGANIRRAALTGDVTASAGSNTTTLADTAVTAGSYTAASITVDSKGRITAASNTSSLAPTAHASTHATGGSDPITPASINTDRPLFENYHGLNAFLESMMDIDYTAGTATPAYIGICRFGDSMAGPYGIPVVNALARKYGVGAYMTAKLGSPCFSASPVFALSGGATNATTDYTITPGSNQINMPAGSNAVTTFDPAATFTGTLYSSANLIAMKRNGLGNSLPMWGGCVKVKLYYVKSVGAGTLDVTFSQPQYTPSNTVVSANAASGLGIVEWTPDDRYAAITVDVDATVATCQILGAVFFAERGVYQLAWNVGGSTMEAQLASLSGGSFNTVARELFQDLNCRLVINHQRAATDTDALENYGTFIDAFKSMNSGKTSFMLCNELPIGGSDVTAFNDSLRSLARTKNCFFVDTYRMLGSMAETLVDFPGISDQTHLYGTVEPFISGRIYSEIDRFVSDNSLAIRNPRLEGGYGNRLSADMMSEALTYRINTQGTYASTSPTVSGAGYAVTSDNFTGLVLTGGASVGSARAAIGSLGSGTGGSAYPNRGVDFDLSFSTAINLHGAPRLSAGHRAMYALGVRSSFNNITVASVTTAGTYGVELALGSDVASPEGYTGLVIRLWLRNSTTTKTSRWVSLPGSLTNQTAIDEGIALTLRWDAVTDTLHLAKATPAFAAAGSPFKPVASITDANLGTINSSGSWVYAAIADDGVTVPAATSTFGITNVVFRHMQMPDALRIP